MPRCSKQTDFSGLDDALGALISAQVTLGKEALKLLGSGVTSMVDGAKGMNLPGGTSCCDIPEPCWMPLSLGEICCQLCPGDTGEICLVVSNEDFQARDYKVVAKGEHAGQVSITDNQFTLGPKERRVVSAKFKVPAGGDDQKPREESCCECNDYEVVLWVLGCRNHYLHWYINTDEKHKDCCHEVYVVDQPDYELHWYDHFHVMRPCYGPATAPK
jgi:hypothetical protein